MPKKKDVFVWVARDKKKLNKEVHGYSLFYQEKAPMFLENVQQYTRFRDVIDFFDNIMDWINTLNIRKGQCKKYKLVEVS